ncbi:MAG: large repetitive protein [Tenuifilum sp.]|uniref:T9SS type A sorting domain-containing protein n=1 Tax=Tenuifilum sp. TaxID=2760880 RepID=UPI0024AA441E|nr:T9SS type A sorting domain-containing protein [Tenuifilum sp.]MDI3527883.1 large repetitive protein [Tenuifilum sp.]
MRTKIFLLTILGIGISTLTMAQSDWIWLKQFTQSPNPNLNNELGIAQVQYSSSGNIYVYGSYKATLTIDETTKVGFPDASSTKLDIFLAKFDPNGNLLWINTIGGSGGDSPDAIVVDSYENVYITGFYQGTCDFGSGNTLTSNGGNDGFIAKYNSDGVFQWVVDAANGTANERVSAIALGKDGNLYVAGMSKSASFTIGDGTNQDIYTNADANLDLFLASFTPTGTYRWSKQVPGDNNSSLIRSISVDESNNLYFGGALVGTLTFDGIPYTSSGSGDIILGKASPTDGYTLWIRKGGSTLDDQLHSLKVYDNYTYIIGYIQGAGTIDSTATLQSSQFQTVGSNDIFLAKYNLEGRLIWKRTIGSTGDDVGYGLNVYNNILVATGYFSNSIDFNLNTVTSGGGVDAGFFVFDVESNAVLANSVSGTLEDRGQGVALDTDYNVYLGGYFTSPTLTVGTNTLTNSASTYNDLFLTKYHNDFTATFTYKKDVSCNGGNDGALTVTPYFGQPPYTYSWLKDGIPFSATDSAITNISAGTYQVTVTDNNSNQSTVSYTIQEPTALSISKTITNVSCYGLQDGAIDITVSGGTQPYGYFWTSGNGNGHIIDSEDQSGLTAGDYDVQVTDANGCTISDNIAVSQPAEIQINGSVTNITGAGNNGAVDITVSGGSGVFTNYSWVFGGSEIATTEDITGLNNGGEYTVTVTDNSSCQNSKSFNVLDERVFHAWVSSKTDVKCKGDNTGEVTISYTDNIGTVSVLWSSGETTLTITNKPAGSYTATLIDDKGTPGDTSDDDTTTVNVDITEPAQILDGSITAYPTTCFGGNDGILDLTPTGGTAPYSYSWNTTPVKTTQDINNLSAGTYQVTITDQNGCTAIKSADITEPAEITFDFLATEPTCYNSYTGSLSVNNLIGGTAPYEYLWSNTLTSPTISNVKGGSYWLKVTDSKGCIKTNYTVLNQPTEISISHTENKPTCPESKNGSIGLTVSGGTPGYTYFWTGPDISSATDKDQINLGPGTYTVTVTDANSCAQQYQIELTSANPAPNAVLTSSDSDNSICIGDNVIFTATGGDTYEFFLNGLPVQGPGPGFSYSNSVLADGDQVYAEVTSSAGCKALTNTITTTVNPLPTVTANASANPVCEGDGVTLTGSGAVSYSWDKGVNDGEEFYPTATDTYTVIGTDANGCQNTDKITVTVNPVPNAVINTTDPLEYCQGETISTTLNASPADGTYYQWLKDGEAIVGANTTTYTATEPGFYSFYVIKNECTGISNDVEIVSHPLPTVTLADFSPVCEDASTLTLTQGFPAGGVYSGIGVSGDTFDPATAGPGNHTITYTYTDGNGCQNSDSKDITVNPLPTVSLADFTPICEDASPITLTEGSPTGGVYSGTGVSGDSFDPTTAGPGNHTITYTITDGNGCVNSASKDIIVNALPSATISTTDPTNWCEGTPIDVTFTAETADSYQWLLNNTPIDGANGQTFNATSEGDYSLQATTNGCTAFGNTITITVQSVPSVSIATSDPTEWCDNETVSTTLTASPSDGQAYQWQKDGTNIDQATSFEYNAADAGTYRVVATFGGGCQATSNEITVTVNPSPTVDLPDDTIKIDASQQYTLDAGAGFVSYLWNDSSTEQTLLVDGSMRGLGTHKFWVTVTNEFGCSATDTAVVKVTSNNSVPTNSSLDFSIYPNPTNGQFNIKVSNFIPGRYRIEIYNSIGGLAFSKEFTLNSTSDEVRYNIKHLPKGLYYIRLGNETKKVIKKLILE